MAAADSDLAPGARPSPRGADDWAAHARELAAAVEGIEEPLLRAALAEALQSLARGDFDAAAEAAEAACRAVPASTTAFRLLGLSQEGRHEIHRALQAYEAAYGLDPASPAILADLGRLAHGLGSHAAAAEFFARALALEPGSQHLARQLSLALAEGGEFKSARTILAQALGAAPQSASLLSALGAILLQEGETHQALDCLNEALRLEPASPEALYNRAIARLELGDLAGARADCAAALPLAAETQKPRIRFVRAQAYLAGGDLGPGWRDYAARLDPDFPTAPRFAIDRPRLRDDQPLRGLSLLAVAEQGLGDEIMFAGVLEDLADALGPGGRLVVTAAPRLASIFARSFPTMTVRAQAMDGPPGASRVLTPEACGAIDAWCPMGDLVARLRPSLGAFEGRTALLAPDPSRLAHWTGALQALGPRPKVGLSWKSMRSGGHRTKQFAPFAQWRPVLQVKDVTFVNLQYGECAPEFAAARAMGAGVYEPPGLDLTNDLEGALALSAALDLVIGVCNASTNLAAAAGTPAWYLFPPVAWPALGSGRHPWFARTRGFAAQSLADWSGALEDVAAALAARRFGDPAAAEA